MKPRRNTTTAVAKRSVSLRADHDAWLRERSRQEGRPLSSILGDVVEDAKKLAARRELQAWLEAGQQRPITAEELEEVAREWRPARRGRRSA